MKKLNLWLLASLFVAAFVMTACNKDDDEKKDDPQEEEQQPAQDPQEEQPSAKDLIGTWVFTNPSNEDNFLKLTLADDNSFSLSLQKYSNLLGKWAGSWAEKDGDIVVTVNQYTIGDKKEDVERKINLCYKKMANGFLIYFDQSLPKGMKYGGIFVREGETLDVSKLGIDKELIGKWETEDKKYSYIFNADGTFKYTKPDVIYGSETRNCRFAEIDPLPVGEGKFIKQFVDIEFIQMWYPMEIKADVRCYVIQDGRLYTGLSEDIKTIDDLLKTTPYIKVTEE